MAIRTDTIVTRYEAHTISHEQGVDRIRTKQKQLELQLKDWNEEAKRNADITATAWKNAGLALAGVTAAVVAGRAAFQHYAREQRLAAAAGDVSLTRLSKAAGGLRTQMELLEFAARAQHGAFKLSHEQMETALKAMRQLTREGNEQADVTQKVTDALVKLEGDGLKDFGIRVREAKTDTEKFNAIMDALAEKARKVDGTVATSTESVEQMGVGFVDAFDKIKRSVGEMVVSMEPLIRAAGALTSAAGGLLGMIADGWRDLADMGFAGFGDEAARKRFGDRYSISYDKQAGDWYLTDALETFKRHGGSEADFIAGGMSGSFTRDTPYGDRSVAMQDLDPRIAAALKREAEAKRQLRRPGSGAGGPGPIALGPLGFGSTVYGAGRGGLGEAARTQDPFGNELYGINLGDYAGTPGRSYEDFVGGRSQNRLAQMFGPISEFDAYAKGFEILSGAIGSAMSAWIDGSASAGEAIKKFIAEGLKATAVDMSMQAIKHGAYALGSLAYGNLAGAASHGKAAAAYAAGAVVIGAAAKQLHGGGASSSAGAAPAAPSYGGGAGISGGGDQGSTRIVVYGEDYTNQSARQRQLHAERLLQQANSAGTVYA